MSQEIKILTVKGSDLISYIDDLARLRIEIFREYPYLYLGNLAYEKNYLATYIQSPESIAVIALQAGKVIGVSTAIPMEFESEEVRKPFLEQHYDIKKIFYFGESVLLPAWRGRNLYRYFFQEREAAARRYGATVATFCAVQRAVDDPRKPADYKRLDNVWQHFGYVQHPELCAWFEWQEIGEEKMSAKPLIFWMKKL